MHAIIPALSHAFRRALQWAGRWVARRTAGRAGRLDSRAELSARYLQELSELVADGRISAAVAARIADDLFEPDRPGTPRRLRLSVWRRYVQERSGHVGPHLVVGAGDGLEESPPPAG